MEKDSIKDQLRKTLALGCGVKMDYKATQKSWVGELCLSELHTGEYCISGSFFEYGSLEDMLDKFVKLVFSKKNLIWAIRWIQETHKDLDRIPEDELKKLIAQFKADKTLTIPRLRKPLATSPDTKSA